VSFCAVLVISAALSGCDAPADFNRARASYDPFTSRLVLLSVDQNRDGQIDHWTYLDGNRPLRGEGDTDGDGRIDRWEYFDANAQLVRVGSSSRNDGIEDTWVYVQPVGGESRIDRSRGRDRHIDVCQYFVKDAMVRAEEDSNGDGQFDRWDRYEAGALREAAFDTSLAAGTPDRRLLYDAQGRFFAAEQDVERDGTFVRLTGAAADAAKAGVTK